jgi:Zn-dependent peptidase ImmA (M78 family)
MTKPVRVPVKKEVWIWAIKESQRDEEEIFVRFPKMNKWISGEENPTFKQLEAVADYLKVPFGYMFLENPPKDDVMEIEFRSINNKLSKMSKNLKDTIMEMDRRRNWMSDYRKNLGWDKLEIIVKFNNSKSKGVLDNALLAKKLLNLEENWYETEKSFDDAYKFLRKKLEEVGILVMQSGVVGMNNYRRLDINEFRAFVLYDDVSPLIFINNNDSKAGKIFSLVHEYIHVLFEQEDLFLDEDMDDRKGNEAYINDITAEFLMPKEHIYRLWNKDKEVREQIDELSKLFKVSRLALSIKLRNLSLIDSKTVEMIRDESIKDFEVRGKESEGGDFYKNFHAKISPVFTEAVIRSADAGEISYTDAFRLLGGIKGSTYDNIKKDMMLHG